MKRLNRFNVPQCVRRVTSDRAEDAQLHTSLTLSSVRNLYAQDAPSRPRPTLPEDERMQSWENAAGVTDPKHFLLSKHSACTIL